MVARWPRRHGTRIKIWNTSDWTLSQTIYPTLFLAPGSEEMSYDSLSWSHDSTKLALGSWVNTVTIWDVANGNLVSTLQHASDVTSVAWSPDGKWIASSSLDWTVRVWDAQSGVEVKRMDVPSQDGIQPYPSSVTWKGDSTQLAYFYLDSAKDKYRIAIWGDAAV